MLENSLMNFLEPHVGKYLYPLSGWNTHEMPMHDVCSHRVLLHSGIIPAHPLRARRGRTVSNKLSYLRIA
jgi:hypothetical protein